MNRSNLCGRRFFLSPFTTGSPPRRSPITGHRLLFTGSWRVAAASSPRPLDLPSLGGAIMMGEVARQLPREIQRVARRKLRMFANAKTLQDLRVTPANRLESLKGERKGHWSMCINGQWRICFGWMNGGATNVEIVDYH
jgi:toxin HigB-1